jgi:hypothetical protein
MGNEERTQDRQTESGVRCVGCSGGDAQPSLLSLSLFFKALLLYSSLKPCLKPLSLDSLCPMFSLSCSLV